MENPLKRKITLYPALVLIISTAVSCTRGEALLKPYEEALGPGWTCHVTPDEFKRVGTVVELTNDGRYFFYQEISSTYERVTKLSDLPTLSLRSNFSFSGLSAFLKSLGIDVGTLAIDASAQASYNATTAYGGVSRTALTGEAAKKAIIDLAAQLSSNSSRFYLIREAVSATSADIKIARNQSISVGTDQASSDQTPSTETATANKVFDRPLGVCTISQEIVTIQVAEDGVPLRLPATAVIERKQ